MKCSEAILRINSALWDVGMAVFMCLWDPSEAPCQLSVDGNDEVLYVKACGFAAPGEQPAALFLTAESTLATIKSFADLQGDRDTEVYATEEQAAALWNLLVRAAGDDAHWARHDCGCRECNRKRRVAGARAVLAC